MKLPDRYTPTGQNFSGGGMAVASVCRDSHLDRDVLVKSLQAGVDQKRITDEIAALSSIRSKHVVEIYDLIRDENGDVIALVEELICGDDLNASIPITDATVFLKHAYAIASGLADIHAKKRVHRDIKPNNMKFEQEGCLRIFDFGLSRDETDASTTGTIGTIGYLAPELCVQPTEKAEFTAAIDTFAFGATAIKMIRGNIPKELKEVPPVLPCLDADFSKQTLQLPSPVAEILNRCLAKAPGSRPGMSEVRDLLASYLIQGRHKATLVVNDTIYTLDSQQKSVKVSGAGSWANVEYDGVSFQVTSFGGTVSVNNVNCKPPHLLPGSCVLILGDGASTPRSFVPIDISYPEVVV